MTRSAAVAAILLAPAFAACLEAPTPALPAWAEWTEGRFTFHVPYRDLAAFRALPEVLHEEDANLTDLLGTPRVGRIEVYAYGPNPPKKPDGRPAANPPSHVETRNGVATMTFPLIPLGFIGGTPDRAVLRGVVRHELVHVHQQILFDELRGSRVPMAAWFVEGTATLIEQPRSEDWTFSWLRAATALNGTTSDRFQGSLEEVFRRDRVSFDHQGGALAVHYLARACRFGPEPLVDVVRSLANGSTFLATLGTFCPNNEDVHVAEWRVDLGRVRDDLAARIPPQPTGERITSWSHSERLHAACVGAEGGWIVRSSFDSSRLLRIPGEIDRTPPGLVPLALACAPDGRALVVGEDRNHLGEAAVVRPNGDVVARASVPRATGQLAWDGAHGFAEYAAEGGTRVRIGLDLRWTSAAATSAATRLVVGPAGERAFATFEAGYTTWLDDGSGPRIVAENARPAFFRNGTLYVEAFGPNAVLTLRAADGEGPHVRYSGPSFLPVLHGDGARALLVLWDSEMKAAELVAVPLDAPP